MARVINLLIFFWLQWQTSNFFDWITGQEFAFRLPNLLKSPWIASFQASLSINHLICKLLLFVN